jgi:hypothetical protein
MTLPDERYRAVRAAEQFLRTLCDPAATPGVPKTVRHHAQALLRHYPREFDLDMAAHQCPSIFESPNKLDDLQVFLLQGAESAK